MLDDDDDDEDPGVLAMQTHHRGYFRMTGGKRFVATEKAKELEFQGDEETGIAFFAKYTDSLAEYLIPLSDEDKKLIKTESLNVAAPHVCQDLIARFNAMNPVIPERKARSVEVEKPPVRGDDDPNLAVMVSHRKGYVVWRNKKLVAIKDSVPLEFEGVESQVIFFARYEESEDHLLLLRDEDKSLLMDEQFSFATVERCQELILQFISMP